MVKFYLGGWCNLEFFLSECRMKSIIFLAYFSQFVENCKIDCLMPGNVPTAKKVFFCTGSPSLDT